MKFVGRQWELEKLREFQSKQSASLIVIRGRRRIGKSRLIEEFSKRFANVYNFAGLAPDEKTTTRHQLDEFSRQLARALQTAPAYYADWSDAFWALGERVQNGAYLIVFDEISWMGSKDPTFLGKIKNLWDLYLKKNDKLIFIVCGSAASWIEKNILKSTGFVGRVSYTMTLEELPLSECSKLWGENIDAYEKLKFLSVSGGVPKYLEEMNPSVSAEENIKRLCFTKGGFLVEEFERIFTDIFLRQSDIYKQILQTLIESPKDQKMIFESLSGYNSSRVSEYLHELEMAGFVQRDYSWRFRDGKDKKISLYRLRDNYVRFYLKFIEPNLSMIRRNSFQYTSLNNFPGLLTILGLQFENLVLGSRHTLHHVLSLDPNDIVNANPYVQRKTQRTQGCQIDYLIQTRHQNLCVCEIKFSKNPIEMEVVTDVRRKIACLTAPKGFSKRGVLVHVNGVTQDVIDSHYFSHIIDFGELLNPRREV